MADDIFLSSKKQTQVKVVLWNVSRSASTALLKSLSGIEGIKIFAEFYSCASVLKTYYRKITGRYLPPELPGNEAVYGEANDLWQERFGGERFIPRNVAFAQIKEDMERDTSKYVLIKANLKSLETFDEVAPYLPSGFRHTFLIRDPVKVFLSARKFKEFYQVPGSVEDYDIIRDDPFDTPQTWFERQFEIWNYVQESGIDPDPVVIDTDDLLLRPGETMTAYCEAVGLPYSDDLLRWEAGGAMPGNIVYPNEAFIDERHNMYKNAMESTCFVAPRGGEPIPRDQLTNDVIRCVDQSTPYYQKMFKRRLQP